MIIEKMAKWFKSRSFQSEADLLHLDQYPMISTCLIQTHLKLYGDDVDISTLSGQALLPPFDDSISKQEQISLIKNSAPIMIYNAIYHENMPARKEMLILIDYLETSLAENSNNPWIELLLNAYHNNQLVNKEYLLSMPSQQITKLEVSRASFDQQCGEVLIKITNHCLKNRKALFAWMIANKV